MISNVYSYYMSEYGMKPYTKHSTHKKTELRDLYNNIVKLNRKSPFYNVDISEESQKQAIDIKESARDLSDVTEDLTDAASGNMTFKSVAQNSRPDLLDAEYIGENKSFGASPSFSISIDQLAAPQVNTGNFLSSRARNLFTGTYSFDVSISSITYELQFSVKDEENNLDIQNKLSRLINNSNIGLSAKVLTDGDGHTALSLTSNMTGVGEKPVIFTVSDEASTQLSGAVEVLGLNKTTQYPSNAVFSLNGESHISSSNSFTVDREFEITLKDVSKSEEDVANIGLKQNMDSLLESMNSLVNNYNNLLTLAKNGTGHGIEKLYSELKGITNTFSDVLNENGIDISEDGFLSVDTEKLQSFSDDGSLMNVLSSLNKFKNSIQNKSNSIMMNPMEFINKTVISYKNPQRPSADPYTTSVYSGMMFNGYC